MSNILQKFGYSILKIQNTSFPVTEQVIKVPSFYKAIIDRQFDIIYDVGANIGQYGDLLRKYGFDGKIISFEPIKILFSDLYQKAEKDRNWIALNFALGREKSRTIMNISRNMQSNSILEIDPNILNVEKNIEFIGKENIKIETFDFIYSKYSTPDENIFLKIDVQGYENKVIEGAIQSIGQLGGLQLEMSLISNYRGELLFTDMITKLEKVGFYLFDFIKVFINHTTGQLIQIDGLFFPKDEEI